MASVTNSTSSTTSSYSYLQYKNKIGGLVSGMDIDSIMEKLMKAESSQMEKLQQQKQKYEWKRDSYREVNTSLSSFRDGIWNSYGTSSSWNSKVASSTSSAVSATATSTSSGTLNISAATVATAGSTVFDLGTANGAQITGNTTLADLNLTDGSFKLNVLSEDGVTYKEKEVSYKSTDTVSSVLAKLNSSSVGVTAIVSGSKVSLTANNVGKGDATNGSIGLVSDSNGFFSSLGINTAEGSSLVDNGSDSSLTVNGVTLTGTTNKYTVAGYSLTVNQSYSSSEAIKVSSTTNTDSLVNKVKEFVDTYNGLIKDLNSKTTEKKNVDYSPLTDAQKAEMTTDEIAKWEEKAKAGLLKSDSSINTALSNMRAALSEYGYTSTDANGNKLYTGGSGDTLAKLGITTSTTWSDKGKLEIDEDKLRAAIENDPDAISRIFTGNATTGEKGIISSLRATAKTAIDNIEATAGKATSTSDTSYSLGKTISSLSTKISDWKDRLKDIEERYWKQFSAMETAIQKANNQSSIFSS